MNNLMPTTTDLSNEIGETTAVSWTAPSNMTFDDWSRIGRTMQQIGRSLNWWIGDWLNQGEMRYGEMYAQALELTGMPQETLSKFRAVASRVPAEIRQEKLTWTHHFAVAYGESRHRGPMLEIAARYDIHTRDLKEVMRLRPAQLDQLIDGYYADEAMSYAEFVRLLNQIRLDVPEQGMVNGRATYLTDSGDDDDDPTLIDGDGAATFASPSAVDDDEAGDMPAPRAAPTRPRSLPPGAYLEEVFDFFEDKGVPCTHVLRQEIGWKGMILRATLDEKGRPVLSWEKTNATSQAR